MTRVAKIGLYIDIGAEKATSFVLGVLLATTSYQHEPKLLDLVLSTPSPSQWLEKPPKDALLPQNMVPKARCKDLLNLLWNFL